MVKEKIYTQIRIPHDLNQWLRKKAYDLNVSKNSIIVSILLKERQASHGSKSSNRNKKI